MGQPLESKTLQFYPHGLSLCSDINQFFDHSVFIITRVRLDLGSSMKDEEAVHVRSVEVDDVEQSHGFIFRNVQNLKMLLLFLHFGRRMDMTRKMRILHLSLGRAATKVASSTHSIYLMGIIKKLC